MTNPFTKVTVIGDTQDRPDMTKDHWLWMARHIIKKSPNYVVHIGDFSAFDSLNAWAQKGSLEDKQKPSLIEDLASAKKCNEIFFKELKRSKSLNCQFFLTEGNHEDRLNRYENLNPEMADFCYSHWETMIEGFGWTIIPYKESLNLEGVDFTHTIMSEMNKPKRGKNPAWAITQDIVRDVVVGHTHKPCVVTRAKVGHDFVRVIDVGSSMPDNYIEGFAKGSLCAWGWGITDICIYNNHAQGWSFTTMKELEHEYAKPTTRKKR